MKTEYAKYQEKELSEEKLHQHMKISLELKNDLLVVFLWYIINMLSNSIFAISTVLLALHEDNGDHKKEKCRS